MVKSMEHGWTLELDTPETEPWFSYILVELLKPAFPAGSSSTTWE